MEIKSLPKIKIEAPEFRCDKFVINKKLENHPCLCHFNRSNFCIVNGRPGSGKSSIISHLLTARKPKIYRKAAHKIHMFIPEHSLRSMEDEEYTEGVSHMYHELNEGTLAECMTQIEADALEDLKSIVVIDDFAAALKNHAVEEVLKRMVYNRRHLGIIGVILVSQIYNLIPLSIRKAASILFTFKPINRKESDSIMGEIVGMNNDQFNEVLNYVFSPTASRHDFLVLIPETGQLFRRFDEELVLRSPMQDVRRRAVGRDARASAGHSEEPQERGDDA